MGCRKRSISNDADMLALHKEWDEASCPICMDHPHNAVLLLCSSHDKGCRSFICDTSYRHSNCLDRFRKLTDENKEGHDTPPGLNPRNIHNLDNMSNVNRSLVIPDDHSDVQGDHNLVDLGSGRGRSGGAYARHLHLGMIDETARVHGPEDNNSENSDMSNLRCPLCRGTVLGWKVVEEARRYLNSKHRSCTRESCSFCGDYSELRRHARRVHPASRPADVDRSRQRAWRRLETQREYDDIVTAIRSAMPGAIVVGDYVIENPQDNRLPGDNRERGRGENGRSLSTFLLFQMIDSMGPDTELRGRGSGAISRHRRSPGGFARRRYMWGENLLGGVQGNDTDMEDALELEAFSDAGEGSPSNPRRRRQRRRFTRTRADYD